MCDNPTTVVLVRKANVLLVGPMGSSKANRGVFQKKNAKVGASRPVVMTANAGTAGHGPIVVGHGLVAERKGDKRLCSKSSCRDSRTKRAGPACMPWGGESGALPSETRPHRQQCVS
mmetsp:Transcript_80713/g.147746  ORF Transcript_80713/g.147746 Transcript_80713/m.147746 type:complete len:117 (+) Transcript_80713:72-422(+)